MLHAGYLAVFNAINEYALLILSYAKSAIICSNFRLNMGKCISYIARFNLVVRNCTEKKEIRVFVTEVTFFFFLNIMQP